MEAGAVFYQDTSSGSLTLVQHNVLQQHGDTSHVMCQYVISSIAWDFKEMQ